MYPVKLTVVGRCPAGDRRCHRPLTAVDHQARRRSGRRRPCRRRVVAGQRRPLAVAIAGAPGRLGGGAFPAGAVLVGVVDDGAASIMRVDKHRQLLLLLLLLLVMVVVLMQPVCGDHVRVALRVVVVVPRQVLVRGSSRVVIGHRAGHVTRAASVRR